jgi:acetoin:2,6-dichlorophenolindophenol oxidoreductase subunit beta
MRVVEDLNGALHGLMAEDAALHVIGEDILDPYGGAFKVTKGLSSAFPDRVMTAPISEAGIVGFATGMAMRGKPVIAEIMFGDFLTLATDQLVNHASKIEWMFNGAVQVPLVVRTPMGGGRGYGPTHSQSLEKHFCGVPGLTVLAAHQFSSPGALLREACEMRSPVLFVEHKVAYPKLVEPDRLPRFESPDLIIVSYGGMADACVRAAERLGAEEELQVEVTLIERLSPFDDAKVHEAAERCGRILAVEEGAAGWGFGSECARAILERGMPNVVLKTIAAPPHPIPNSRPWELEMLPNEGRICEALLALLEA